MNYRKNHILFSDYPTIMVGIKYKGEKNMDYKNEFPIVKQGKTFLAWAGLGTIPEVGIQALEEAKSALTNAMIMFPLREEIRKERAKMINAKPEEIALTPTTTAAICRILNSFEYNNRKKLVVSALNFPTIPFACEEQRRRGAEVAYVPSPQEIGNPPNNDIKPKPSDYEKAIDENTRMVFLTGACWRTGFRQDNIKEIIEIAHKKGAYVCLDNGQTAGQFSEDVKKSDVDFLVSVAYKKLMCPMGSTYLYVKEELIDKLRPLETGYFSDENPIESYPRWLERQNIGEHTLSKTASRFELGHPPLLLHHVSVAILKWLNKIGIKNIEEHGKDLMEYLAQRIAEEGYETYETNSPYSREQRSHVTLRNVDAHGLDEKLQRNNIIAMPAGNDDLRIAPHLSNTKEDIDEIMENLKEIM